MMRLSSSVQPIGMLMRYRRPARAARRTSHQHDGDVLAPPQKRSYAEHLLRPSAMLRATLGIARAEIGRLGGR